MVIFPKVFIYILISPSQTLTLSFFFLSASLELPSLSSSSSSFPARPRRRRPSSATAGMGVLASSPLSFCLFLHFLKTQTTPPFFPSFSVSPANPWRESGGGETLRHVQAWPQAQVSFYSQIPSWFFTLTKIPYSSFLSLDFWSSLTA